MRSALSMVGDSEVDLEVFEVKKNGNCEFKIDRRLALLRCF
jgi:hypothetical protein